MAEYVFDQEIISGSATVRIYRPVLTEKEREIRMNEQKRALMEYGKAMQDAEKNKKKGTA